MRVGSRRGRRHAPVASGERRRRADGRTEKWKETTTDPTTLVIVTLSRLYRNIQSSLLLAERPALALARNTVTNRDRAPLLLVNSSLPFYCVPPSSSVRLDNVQRDDKVSCLTLALLSRWALDGRAFLCVFIRAWRVTDDERTKLLLVRRRSLLFPWSLVTVKIILSLSLIPSLTLYHLHKRPGAFSARNAHVYVMGSPVGFVREIFGRVAAHLSRFATCNILKLLAR